MNVIAFLFAIIGATLNMFQPVIRTPASGSTFTGSMFDAVGTIMTSSLPGEGGTVLAILILAVLCLVPVVAAVKGLFIPSSERDRTVIILFLCALADGLAAWEIYHLSSESFMSPFLTNYIVPYAQKVSFIAPAIWATCYLIASVLVMIMILKTKPMDSSKTVYKSVVFGLGWSKKTNSKCDLDACAFLFATGECILSADDDIIYGGNTKLEEYPLGPIVHGSKAVWLTGDNTSGNTKEGNEKDDLEQIIVLLDKVPPEIHKIVFAVTAVNCRFRHATSPHVQLVDMVDVDEDHIKDKTLKFDLTQIGRNLDSDLGTSTLQTSKEGESLSDKDALIVAEIHRTPKGGWGWNKIEEARDGGFDSLCEYYGIPVQSRR
ncbi:MAG: TerD family protein [Synergistaceae bacterium]|nr:TerD family protein [Synergistaceae bacterium]